MQPPIHRQVRYRPRTPPISKNEERGELFLVLIRALSRISIAYRIVEIAPFPRPQLKI